MRAIIPALFGALAFGQTLTLTSTAPVVPAGATVTLNLTMAGGAGPAAIQFDVAGLPAGALVATPPALSTKVATCNGSPAICLILAPSTAAQPLTQANGLAPIPDGLIAVITYTQPPSTPATVTIPATGIVTATPAGAAGAVLTPAATPVTVGIQSHCDVNGDGVINSVDVGLVVTAALQGGAGSPTALDVIREIIAAFGGACLR